MRVTFLIDGFNLYHSLLDAENDTGVPNKWLDLKSLLSTYLPHIDRESSLHEIYFFTALRNHVRTKNPQTVKRHERYLKILQDTGVQVVKGRFKKGESWCKNCSSQTTKYEEKETDVNIAVSLIELAYLNKADVFVIVSGDTDLMPGIDVVNRNFPDKVVHVIFPYKRKNDEYKSRVGKSFKLKTDSYLKHQLPDPYIIGTTEYKKPSHW